MKDIKAVVFDCDGVMFDTEKANKAFYNQILTRFNLPEITSEQFEYAQMHTADEAITHLFKDPKHIEVAQAYRKRLSYHPFIQYMEIEPYLKTLLKKLRPTYKTAIATNRSDTMAGVLKAFDLGGYFDLVVSALDVERPKPHPDSLNKVIEKLNISPIQSIYIGDSKLDELASKNAGVPFVAFKNRLLSADFHITSLKEIEDILS